MNMNSLLAAIAIAVLLNQPASAHPAAEVTAFERLKTLIGEWEGKTDAGRVLKVNYRLTANNTVVIETWTLSPTRESLTLYHLDGERLLATHYCPIGNQPRLQFKPGADADKLSFDFDSATNLVDPKTAHQQQFNLEFLGPDSLRRDETYVENGESGSESVAYTRIR